MRERLGDVSLHQLELRPHGLDAVQGGGVGDLPDRVCGGLHRRSRPALGVRQLLEMVLETRAADGERLEPLVGGGDQRPDRLIARQDRDDALLLGTHVLRGGPPNLAGNLSHEPGRLLLDRPDAFIQPIVDRALQELRQPSLGLADHGLGLNRLATGEEPAPEEPGLLGGGGRTTRTHRTPRLSGAARGRRPPKHRAEIGRTHVADMGKCVRRAGGSATTCRGYTEAPEAPTSGDRRRRRVAQLAEHRSPKPGVGGSSPSAPAKGAA